jgi:hypothetical protein
LLEVHNDYDYDSRFGMGTRTERRGSLGGSHKYGGGEEVVGDSGQQKKGMCGCGSRMGYDVDARARSQDKSGI